MNVVNGVMTIEAIKYPEPCPTGIVEAMEIGTKAHAELLEMERKAQAKPFPKVGDTIQIRHMVKRNKAGETVGIQRNDGKPERTKITAVYLDGTVRSGISDVWTVRPSTNHAWETINPDREEK